MGANLSNSSMRPGQHPQAGRPRIPRRRMSMSKRPARSGGVLQSRSRPAGRRSRIGSDRGPPGKRAYRPSPNSNPKVYGQL